VGLTGEIGGRNERPTKMKIGGGKKRESEIDSN
jgi:hypothetical protein